MKPLYRSASAFSKMRAALLSIVAAAPVLLQAQVSQYAFSQSTPGYPEITADDGGYLLGTPTFNPPQHNLRAWDDPNDLVGYITNGGYLNPAIGPGFPIGFDFTYNGNVFDRIGVANGGWISFGKSSDGNNAVVVFTSDHSGGRPLYQSYNGPTGYKRNRIAGFANSQLRAQDQTVLGGPISSLRLATIGTAPNRVCVIQWKDYRASYSYDGDVNRINFQIRLNESDNSVEVRYGFMKWGWAAPGGIQVGLGGSNNEDFNNRMTVWQEPVFNHDWNTTVAGTTNISACMANNTAGGQGSGAGVVPVIGTSFKWTPSSCPLVVWPLLISGRSFDRATASWSELPGVSSYDYVLSTTPDPTTPTPVATGNTTDLSVTFTGLQQLTHYYVFVRSRCGGNVGGWSLATIFRTEGGGVLVCGDEAVEVDYCYQSEETVWYYSTSDGESPVRLSFTGGNVSNGSAALRIWYGPDTTGTPFWTAANGNLPGQVFTSTGPHLTIKLRAQWGCVDTEWLNPLQWTVGCRDCTEPLAVYTVANTDCALQQYSVQVMVVSLGTASSVSIANDQGVASTVVPAPGLYTVGPFTAGLPVTITVENPVNALCNVSSPQLVNDPCAVVGCGPELHTFCFDQNDQRQWLYQGDGAPIGIRFIQGSVGYYAEANTYNAIDPFSVNADVLPSGLSNVLRKSTNPDNALLLGLTVDQFAVSTCANGQEQEWQYVVACYDGCTQPVASFTRAECTQPGTFKVAVNITELGSTGSVTITNNGGAPSLVATTTGVHLVGPFISGSTVRVEVEGASPLCTWSSAQLNYSCLGMSISEMTAGSLQLYPNPTGGHLRVVLPSAVGAGGELDVFDLMGRSVHRERMVGPGQGELQLDLSDLQAGSYMVVVKYDQQRYIGRVTIEH